MEKEERPGRLRIALHRLSLKMALAVAGLSVLGLLLLAFFVEGVPYAAAPVVAALLGFATYMIAYRMVAARINLARDTLREIRHRRFENLEAAHLPQGDELNSLVWQVYRTGQALEKEIHDLKKIESYRREFLGNVSHELKTPIFSIQGFAETLLSGALEDPRVNRSFTEKILRNATRLKNLTYDLAEISQIETGELKMSINPFSLSKIICEVVESLEPMAQAKGISLQYQVPPGLPLVSGDGERIRQVLVNLVDNAIKYNNEHGTVEIVVRRLPSGDVKISVVDNGIGVSPEDIPRLTERFYRVDKSRSRVQGGTGLGLAIVKHILAAHERSLMVKSNIGRGSTFGFILPAEHPAGPVD